MRLSGPVVEAPDVPALVRFYERFLGWEVEELVGPREHYQRPVWPGELDKPTMQWHLDWWVENLDAGVAWAIECGAVEASPQPENRDLSRLRIMLDPAGHPFCLWT